MNKYERAAHDNEVYKARVARVFDEMLHDPESRFHGTSYATRPGCPCKCSRCEAKREEYRAGQRIRSRRFREGRKQPKRPRMCPICHEYPQEYDTELGYTIRCSQDGHMAATWGDTREDALREWNERRV